MSQGQDKYDEWLRLLESEDRVPSAVLIPSKKVERLRDVEQHQAELEMELQARITGRFGTRDEEDLPSRVQL